MMVTGEFEATVGRRVRRRVGGGITALLLTLALPLFGHHSFSAEFDAKKPVTLTGEVVMMEWANPHSTSQTSTSLPHARPISANRPSGASTQVCRLSRQSR